MDRIQDIRSRYFREGQSIRQIARELGMSRRTVRRYIQSDGPWRYTLKEPRPRPVADDIEPIVREIIENDQQVRNRKQRHTARRIYVRLVEEHGYRGSERTVRRLVAAIKQEMGARSKEVFLPLEFEYGQAFEADWLEADVEMGGQLVTVNVLAARLRASRASFVKAYPTTRQEALFDGLQEAFHFWEGVPETGRFDNPRTVAKIIKRYTREENERFAQFRAHYGFKLSLCTPREGHENVMVKAYVDRVEIWRDGAKVAEHRRSYVKGGETYELGHYLPLPARKPGAIPLARPVKSSEMAAVIEQFHRGLRGRAERPATEMAKIMELMREAGIEVVGRALELAVRRSCFSYDAVACITRALIEEPEPPAPLSPERYPHLPHIPATTVSLGECDALLARGDGHGL